VCKSAQTFEQEGQRGSWPHAKTEDSDSKEPLEDREGVLDSGDFDNLAKRALDVQ